MDRKDLLIIFTCAIIIASIAYTPFVLIHQHTDQIHVLHRLLNQTTITSVTERDILQNTIVTLFAISEKEDIGHIEANGTHFIIYDVNDNVVGITRDISTKPANYSELSYYLPVIINTTQS